MKCRGNRWFLAQALKVVAIWFFNNLLKGEHSMKFTCSVDIDLPVKRVVEFFDNPANLGKWQKGLVSYEHISGIPGKPGAKSKITIKSGKHIIELMETITVKNLPQEMTGLYEHEHMVNTMTNRFLPLGENRTRYEAGIHYTRFIGFIPKMMALLMPGIFRKQVQETLERFKAFAEGELRNEQT